MKTKKTVAVVLVSAIVIAAALGLTVRATQAQSHTAADPAVLSKLDAILKGQKAIMEELAAIRERLKIVEIRVTQAQ